MIKDPKAPAGAAVATRVDESAWAQRLTRCYVNEGLALLGEGVPAQAIETSALQAGMATGPLALLDELSLAEADRLLHEATQLEHSGHSHRHVHDDEHRHAHEHSHEHGRAQGHEHAHEHGRAEGHVHGHERCRARGHEHGREHDRAQGHEHGRAHGHEHGHEAHEHPRSPAARHGSQERIEVSGCPPSPHGMTTEAIYVLEKMAHGFGRMGRHAGRGFYDYGEGQEPELWSGLKMFERRRNTIPAEDIRDRLLYAQAVESLRCLEEGMARPCGTATAGPSDTATSGPVPGMDFAAASGAALAFIDKTGLQAFAARAGELVARYGKRFEPPALLMRHAETGTPLGDGQ